MSVGAMNHIFGRSGLVPVSDLQTDQWRSIFSGLEEEQEVFLDKESAFMSPEYRWQRDPLHFWSRVWEYPYVYYHLNSWRSEFPERKMPVVADLGSAVTFFPFVVAKLACEVLCLDIDSSYECQIAKAASVFPRSPGSVSFRLIADGKLPLEDGEADVVYCISVLEHMPRFEDVISETARVLKPGGLFILTIDLDMVGYMNIGVQRYYDLRRCLDHSFDFLVPECCVHPMDIYQTRSNAPYKPISFTGWRVPWFHFKQRILKPLIGKKPFPRLPNHALWAGVMTSKTGN